MPNYWPGQQQWPGSSSCSVRECCWSVAASGNVAGAGSGALQRTGALQGHQGALQRTGALQGQECSNGHQAGQGARILVKLTRRIAFLEHLPECQIYGPGSSSGQDAAVAAFGVLQERCSVQKRCRSRIRSVAAYKSVSGAGMTEWSPSRSTCQNPS